MNERNKRYFSLYPFLFVFGLLPFVLLEGHKALESYQEFTNEGTAITRRNIQSSLKALTLPKRKDWGLEKGGRETEQDPKKEGRGCRGRAGAQGRRAQVMMNEEC